MSKDRPRLGDYLRHMLQAIERITRYTESLDEVSFLQNDLVQDAVIRNLDRVRRPTPRIAAGIHISNAQRDCPWLL